VRLLPHGSAVEAVAFLPDGRTLAAGGQDNVVTLWDWTTGEKLQVLVGPEDYVHWLAVRADGRLLAASAHDGTVQLGDLSPGPTRRRTVRLLRRGSWLHDVAFSPADRHPWQYHGVCYPDPEKRPRRYHGRPGRQPLVYGARQPRWAHHPGRPHHRIPRPHDW
jgi:hypothetical protein